MTRRDGARRRGRRRLAALAFSGVLGGAALAAAGPADAAPLRACDRAADLSADQQDVLLRFAAVVKAELEASDAPMALVSRSGLDLARLGQRYSHAGLSLRQHPTLPWAVRQLYFACDEGKPRLYDEGIAGFVLGTGQAAVGYLSMVLLPPDAGTAMLAASALDDALALRLLGARYSANAYPFSVAYQNCNQWVAELLATGWRRDSGPPDEPDDTATAGTDGREIEASAKADVDAADTRIAAQRWLLRHGYRPTGFDVAAPWAWMASLSPFLHRDDHPPEQVAAHHYAVSMPASLEAFVQRRVTQARRIEVCHAGARIVVHHGWSAVAQGCIAGPGDTEITADAGPPWGH